MTIPRRRFLHLAAGAAALPAATRIARADNYPARPVHLIVGFGAGSASDIDARLLGAWLSQRLGQQFVVEHADPAGLHHDVRQRRLGDDLAHRLLRRGIDLHAGPVRRVDVPVLLAVVGVGLVEGDAVAAPREARQLVPERVERAGLNPSRDG